MSYYIHPSPYIGTIVQDYRAGPRDSRRIVLFHLVTAPALHARATTAAERGLERVVVLILSARVIVFVCLRECGGGCECTPVSACSRSCA